MNWGAGAFGQNVKCGKLEQKKPDWNKAKKNQFLGVHLKAQKIQNQTFSLN